MSPRNMRFSASFLGLFEGMGQGQRRSRHGTPTQYRHPRATRAARSTSAGAASTGPPQTTACKRTRSSQILRRKDARRRRLLTARWAARSASWVQPPERGRTAAPFADSEPDAWPRRARVRQGRAHPNVFDGTLSRAWGDATWPTAGEAAAFEVLGNTSCVAALLGHAH